MSYTDDTNDNNNDLKSHMIYDQRQLLSDIGIVARGGDSGIKIPGCLCWGSEKVPILKDALGKKHTHIEGFICILHTHNYGVI